MVINYRLGCSDLEAAELRILRGVTKGKSKNIDLGFQASILNVFRKNLGEILARTLS